MISKLHKQSVNCETSGSFLIKNGQGLISCLNYQYKSLTNRNRAGVDKGVSNVLGIGGVTEEGSAG